jgi:GNAT superfamily N-acetyltransferase
MAAVDPDDDEIQRYVVCRYAHDPPRHERRHQVVAAFDNKREFRRLLDRLAGDLQRRRDAGEPIDPSEHFTGLMLEPGYRRRQRGVRLLKKAIQHRVSLSEEQIERLDLPANMQVLRSEKKED